MMEASKDDEQKADEARFNDTLKRMLKTVPRPHVKKSLTESNQKKPDKIYGKKGKSND